ncbi:MAG: DnaJ domain-containing protein [Clostridia bacterium]|nr:DnaJ domain-containing protein [Clostridia bacterium]
MNNPYEILGVGRNASEKDIMDAYRKIAGEINYSNLSDNAKNEKMRELDSAYDHILNEIRGTSAYTQNTRDNYQSTYGNTQFADVRSCINSGRIDDAETILNGVPSQMRNAEWHYLKGMLFQRRGWLNEAINHYKTASSMEPNNFEYANAYNAMKNNANGGYRTSRKGSDTGVCDVCSALLCADCCCECCGGDLIPCC